MANTYLDSPAFQVEVLEEKLELTQAEGNKYTTQWNGQVCYFENWFPNAVRNASCVMVLTPQQWLRDLEKEQTVSLAFHFMSFDILFDYAPKISGFYPLYADPEMTQWVAMYVFIGVENKESVGLTLYWTEEDGAQAFSKVIYYGGNDED